MEKSKSVKKYGSVTKAARAMTPTKEYRIKYFQPPIKVEKVNFWPPGAEPKTDKVDVTKGRKYVQEAERLERSGDALVLEGLNKQQTREMEVKREERYKEATRMYNMAHSIGSPEGTLNFKRMQARVKGQPPTPAAGARPATTPIPGARGSTWRRDGVKTTPTRPSPKAFIAKMERKKIKDEIMGEMDKAKENKNVFSSVVSPKGRSQLLWDSDSDWGEPQTPAHLDSEWFD